MIALVPGMGGGSENEPEPSDNRIAPEIAVFLEQQQFYDVTEVINSLGLNGLILETAIPYDSRFSLPAMFNPDTFDFTLEIAPPPGRAIHDCTEFLIAVSLNDELLAKLTVSLETGMLGSECMDTGAAVRFQGILEAASKASV